MTPTQFEVDRSSWGFPKFVRYERLMDTVRGFLPNDRLTILCDISIMGKQVIKFINNFVKNYHLIKAKSNKIY
jgi:hypothetical protein